MKVYPRLLCCCAADSTENGGYVCPVESVSDNRLLVTYRCPKCERTIQLDMHDAPAPLTFGEDARLHHLLHRVPDVLVERLLGIRQFFFVVRVDQLDGMQLEERRNVLADTGVGIAQRASFSALRRSNEPIRDPCGHVDQLCLGLR